MIENMGQVQMRVIDGALMWKANFVISTFTTRKTSDCDLHVGSC